LSSIVVDFAIVFYRFCHLKQKFHNVAVDISFVSFQELFNHG